MAYAGGGGGDDHSDREDEKWNFRFNPFKMFGIVSEEDANPERINKAFKSKIRECHPDKLADSVAASGDGRDALAKKLTTSFNFLKNKDPETIRKLFQSFNSGGKLFQGSDELRSMSNIIMDKTGSEHYRRIFKQSVDLAREIKFQDNFKSFYKQVFDHVETQPEVKPGFSCHFCEEDFLHEEDHFLLVFEPYYKYVTAGLPRDRDRDRDSSTSGGTGAIWTYLETLFPMKEILSKLPLVSTGNWSEDKILPDFHRWSKFLGKHRDSRDGDLARDLVTFFNKRDSDVDTTLKVLTPLLQGIRNHPGDLSSDEVLAMFSGMLQNLQDHHLALFPALLSVWKNWTKWAELGRKLASVSTKLALFVTVLGKYLQPDQEDDGLFSLGKAILLQQQQSPDDDNQNLAYAHLALLLGSCDLAEVADAMLPILESKSNSTGGGPKSLMVHYLLKTGGLEKVENLAIAVMESSESREQAAPYFYPLLRTHYGASNFDELIRILGLWLPENKQWACVQRLVLEKPMELLMGSQQLAKLTLDRIEEFLDNPLLLLAIFVVDDDSDERLGLTSMIQAVAGALHVIMILSEDEVEGHQDFSREGLDQTLARILAMTLMENKPEVLVAFLRVPGIRPIFQEILAASNFLGSESMTVTPGQEYHTRLLLLRAIYFYKLNRIPDTLKDLAAAAQNTVKEEIPASIASFLTGNTLVQERILKFGCAQFGRLQDFIDDYPDEGEAHLPEQDLCQVLKNVVADLKPKLSKCFSLGGNSPLAFLNSLEKDILGREGIDDGSDSDDDDEASVATPEDYTEKGFSYVDLEVICSSLDTTIASLTMAAHHFYQAMISTPDSCIPEKFAYRRLILEAAEQNLAKYVNLLMLSPDNVTFALRASLSFAFMADHHFSQVLQRSPGKGRGNVAFIEEGKIGLITDRWQKSLNLRILCPVATPEIYTIAEAPLAFLSMRNLFKAFLQQKVRSGQFSRNIPEYLYNQILFNEVWSERLELEKESETEANPGIVERDSFQSLRATTMRSLGMLHGRGHQVLEQVEHQMDWHLLRRTPDGFLDTSNRSLNFDNDNLVYSRFIGVTVNPNSKTEEFLLEKAVPGDAARPALFSAVDMMEIFGNEICGAFLTFDELLYPNDDLIPEYAKLMLPFHPFFQVKFGGLGPDGNVTPERVCGTNLLMTLYHLDLLLKILTTGQEVSANFPFGFRDTLTNLLENLPKELRDVLKPLGQLKKAENLRRLEYIHRFWFSIVHIEQQTENGSESNNGAVTIRFGETKLQLNTMPMIRGESGELEDCADLKDDASPEAEFVRAFNSKMPEIEKIFPIIRRAKELAKICACFSLLHSNKDNLSKHNPNLKKILEMQLPTNQRPYSNCLSKSGRKCDCLNWVPAVFHQMKVTDEQKLEYLFKKKFGVGAPNNAVDGEVPMARLMGGGSGDGASCGENAENGNSSGSSSNSSSTPNLGQYDLLQEYRVYGGVSFFPTTTSMFVAGELCWVTVQRVGWNTIEVTIKPIFQNLYRPSWERNRDQNQTGNNLQRDDPFGHPWECPFRGPFHPTGLYGNEGIGGCFHNEYNKAGTVVEKSQTLGKWASFGAGLKTTWGTAKGFAAGFGAAGWNDLKAIAGLLKDPLGAVNGIKELVTNPAVREKLGEHMYQELVAKVGRIERGFAPGGDEFQAGKDLGELTWHAISAVTAVHGAAKGTASLAKIGIKAGQNTIQTAKTLGMVGALERGVESTVSFGKHLAEKSAALAKQAGAAIKHQVVEALMTVGTPPPKDIVTLMNQAREIRALAPGQRGVIGEMLGGQEISKILPGVESIGKTQPIGGKGLDAVLKVEQGGVTKYVLTEYKYGTGTLSKTKDGLQMSDSWIRGDISNFNRLVDSVGAKEAALIEQAMRNGNVEKWLVHSNQFEHVFITMLGADGKPLPAAKQLSKILSSPPK